MIAGLALLTACSRETPKEAPRAPSPTNAPATNSTTAPEAADLQPVTARGNEPFWAAEIDHDVLTLTRPDHPTVMIPVKPSGPSDHVTWSGKDVTLVISSQTCSDGMSDMTYKMAAEFNLGGETLKGCAFFKADPPKQP